MNTKKPRLVKQSAQTEPQVAPTPAEPQHAITQAAATVRQWVQQKRTDRAADARAAFVALFASRTAGATNA